MVVELFKEDDELIHIKALIIVERDTQKGIIIGHQGQALKKVGAMARKDIERFFGKKVFLEMFVKVEKDWRNRDKWDDYEKAVDEMMLRTSTTEAPWHIIEANSKLYARIKVLEIVVEALEKRLE